MNKSIIALIGIIPIATIFCFYLAGHTTVYSMYEAGERARQFVEQGRPASDCFKMHSFFPIYPSLYSMQSGCIRDYAEIKKDPMTCELLMPNESGWSCFGTVKSELSKGFGCGSTKENINCGVYNIYSKNLGIDDCDIYKEQVLKNWCHQERTATLDNIYECEKIIDTNPGWREECQAKFAFKMKDKKSCESISEKVRKDLCMLEIDAWLKYSDQWSFSNE